MSNNTDFTLAELIIVRMNHLVTAIKCNFA